MSKFTKFGHVLYIRATNAMKSLFKCSIATGFAACEGNKGMNLPTLMSRTSLLTKLEVLSGIIFIFCHVDHHFRLKKLSNGFGNFSQ